MATVNLDTNELQKKICEVLSSKKASKIQSVSVKEKTIVADYFVIASGKSSTHVKSLVDYVDTELSKMGISPTREEGVREGRWAVLDYGGVILHIFNDEARDFYQLEKLWSDGKNVTVYGDED